MYAYLKICESVTTDIEQGLLIEDQKLPTEQEMCKQFDVSISTVRKAMYNLRDKGLIYSTRGSGYYVSKKQPEYSNLQRPSLSKLGSEPSAQTEVINFQIRRCNITEASNLKIKVNSIIYEIIRKRSMGGKLNMLELNLVPVDVAPDLLKQDAMVSLNKVYLDNHIERIKVRNKLVWFTPEQLAVFDCAKYNSDQVKFNLERKLELLNGKVIEYSQMLIFEEELNFEYVHLY